mgnify:CR=1 FL=1
MNAAHEVCSKVEEPVAWRQFDLVGHIDVFCYLEMWGGLCRQLALQCVEF